MPATGGGDALNRYIKAVRNELRTYAPQWLLAGGLLMLGAVGGVVLFGLSDPPARVAQGPSPTPDSIGDSPEIEVISGVAPSEADSAVEDEQKSESTPTETTSDADTASDTDSSDDDSRPSHPLTMERAKAMMRLLHADGQLTECFRKSPRVVECGYDFRLSVEGGAPAFCTGFEQIKQPSWQERLQTRIGSTYCAEDENRTGMFEANDGIDDFYTPRTQP